jgi:hypothetical protein
MLTVTTNWPIRAPRSFDGGEGEGQAVVVRRAGSGRLLVRVSGSPHAGSGKCWQRPPDMSSSDSTWLDLGPEWELLEQLVHDPVEAADRGAFVNTLARVSEWNDLVSQARRHQVSALLAFHLGRVGALDAVPAEVRNVLLEELRLNTRRIKVLREEAAGLTRALHESGVHFVFTKGMVFESTIYHGNGTRRLNDIDLLIAPSHRETVQQLLFRRGYRQGFYDLRLGCIKPLSRRDLVRYALHPDHLPFLAKEASDEAVPALHVDVANSLTWIPGPYDVPVAAAVSETASISLPDHAGTPVPCLVYKFQLLFTILHLFREAWCIDHSLEDGNDVSLKKFIDVARLLRAMPRPGSIDELTETARRHGVIQPVMWVLGHLDRVFRTDWLSRAGLGAELSESWLASAHSSDGTRGRWRGTMRERLRCCDRRLLFSGGHERASDDV